jgi:hypothetical protein
MSSSNFSRTVEILFIFFAKRKKKSFPPAKAEGKKCSSPASHPPTNIPIKQFAPRKRNIFVIFVLFFSISPRIDAKSPIFCVL